jgi:CelD/BcsL family acetyltransferase involved in cellulose biosynthesis
VRVIDTPSEFEQLHDRWSELHAQSTAGNVFTSHEWLHAWWTAYRPAARLVIVAIEEHERLVALAPMMIVQRHRLGFAARVLCFIGDGTAETDHIDFLIRAAAGPAVLARLLEAMATLNWDIAEFNGIPESSPTVPALRQWIASHDWYANERLIACPVRQLPESFESLLASLPSRLRTSVRSTRRKLAANHRVEFGRHERIEELDSALVALFDNHASRWQGKGQSGVFVDERKRDFYARLTPRLLQRGWLRFFYLKLDDRIIAQQYCFAVDGTVMLLQEGFDFARAQDNVGNALRAFVFERLIEDGARCYDFLAGTSRHKASWSNDVVYDAMLACARRSWRGSLLFAVPQAWERVKDRLRPLRDRLAAALRSPGARGGRS